MVKRQVGENVSALEQSLRAWTGTVVYTQRGTLDNSEDWNMRLGSVFGLLTSQDRRLVFLLTCYEIGDQRQ